MTDNIIKLDTDKRSEFKIRRKAETFKKGETTYLCAHTKLFLDEARRMLQCRNCGCWIEPYDYIWQWVNKEWRVIYSINYLKKEEKKLNKKLDELKREERNIKARIRNAKKNQ